MRVYVSRVEEIIGFIRAAGEEVVDLRLPATALPEGEIVAIDVGSKAKELALELVSRGVRDARVSYIDLNADWVNGGANFANPKHLHWDDVVALDELGVEAEFPTYSTGLPYLDNRGDGGAHTAKPWWRWRIPELVVMAGAYGSGKSTVGQMLAAGFVTANWETLGSGAMLCSWEDIGSEVYRNFKLFGDRRGVSLTDKVHFVRRDPDDDRLVSWYMDLVRYHRERFGTRFFILDPWNEMDHQKDMRMAETDYVKEMMKQFRRMVDKLGIILVVATHVPAKSIRGNGSIEPFRIGHAFGSVQFANKADRGICVVRTKSLDPMACDIGQQAAVIGHTVLRLDKAKVERKMGKKATIALSFEEDSFKFKPDIGGTMQVQDIWKD